MKRTLVRVFQPSKLRSYKIIAQRCYIHESGEVIIDAIREDRREKGYDGYPWIHCR